MKFLIITQKLDLNDDLLGFMHGWIFEFAKHCERVTVIALGVGEYKLPANVKVLSLGKENISQKSKVYKVKSKLIYCLRFYKYIWQERKNYDKVFVHMNKEYVILGGLFWKIQGKKTALWYNHLKGNIFSKISGALADAIFYTSPFSFFAKNKKAVIMPAGIYTDVFRKIPEIKRAKNSLLFLGRISPVKNLETLVGAVKLLNEKGVDFNLNIIGEAEERDSGYFEKIKKSAGELERAGKIKFFAKRPNFKTPEIYNQNEIFINLTDSGSLDKTTLEAMACESLVIASNKSFEKIFTENWHNLMMFKEKDENDLAEKIIKLLNLSEEEKEDVRKKSRELVIEGHGLKKLMEKIISCFDSQK